MEDAKVYKLSMSPNYVSEWTPADAIREVNQNALDNSEKLNYLWEEASTGWELTITTPNVELPASLLLLGGSSKSEGDSNRGSKGEGKKISFLVLLREGLTVECFNGTRKWTPYFDQCEYFGAEMLHVRDEFWNIKGTDLTYVISGISDSLRQEVIDNTLAMQGDYTKVETDYGDILKDHKHHGKVFVGGLFVCKTSDVSLGYDFKPSVMPLNRDRKQLDTWNMKANVNKMHMEKSPASEVAEMIVSGKSDLNYLQYHSEVIPEEVVEEVFKLHVKINGDVPLADNYTKMQEMQRTGFPNVVNLGNDTLTRIVKMSVNYNEVPTEEVDIPHVLMLKWMDKYGDELSNEAYEALSEITERSALWQ